MEQVLLEMFDQARKLVVETDRKLAEENDRIRERERESQGSPSLPGGSSRPLTHQQGEAGTRSPVGWSGRQTHSGVHRTQPEGDFRAHAAAGRHLELERPGRWAVAAMHGRSSRRHGGRWGVATVSRSPDDDAAAIGNWWQKGQHLAAKKPVQPEPTGRWQDTPVPMRR